MQGDSARRRTDGRFYIDGQATRVTVIREDADPNAAPIEGQVADLSARGAKLSLNGRLGVGERVQLQIEFPSIRAVVEKDAFVRWQQPRDSGSWWTGCEIVTPFATELIERLAASHILNRRRDPRYPVAKPARARWELTDEVVEVELQNFSKGGFCVLFPHNSVAIRERLMLLLEVHGKEVAIPGRVMWHGAIQERYAVGCAFATVEGFLKVRAFADIDGDKRRRMRTSVTNRRTISYWTVITLFVLAALQSVRLIVAHPDLVLVGDRLWQRWFKSTAVETTRPVSTSNPTATTETPASDDAIVPAT